MLAGMGAGRGGLGTRSVGSPRIQDRSLSGAVSPCRTARANNPGIVLTFVLPTEQSQLGKIEELLDGGKSQGQGLPRTPQSRDSSVTSHHLPARPCLPQVPCSIPTQPSIAGTAPITDEQAQVQ